MRSSRTDYSYLVSTSQNGHNAFSQRPGALETISPPFRAQTPIQERTKSSHGQPDSPESVRSNPSDDKTKALSDVKVYGRGRGKNTSLSRFIPSVLLFDIIWLGNFEFANVCSTFRRRTKYQEGQEGQGQKGSKDCCRFAGNSKRILKGISGFLKRLMPSFEG